MTKAKGNRSRTPSKAVLRGDELDALVDEVLGPQSVRKDDGYSGDLTVLDQIQFAPAPVLARFCLEDALPRSIIRQLRASKPCVVVIETQSAGWVEPIGSALWRIFARESFDVLRVTKTPTGAAAKSLEQRVIGRPLVAITPDVSFLPRAVVAAADVVIRPRASARAVASTFRALFGRSARVSQRDLAGLDFDDIVLAIRPNSSPRDCLARMRRAAAGLVAATDSAPTLDELAAGGEALKTLKAVAADLARVRDGALSGVALPSLLLYGLPGTGKTTLAKALARTAGLPLVSSSIGDWFSANAHLGTVIGALRSFFEAAIAAAPCIALLDELDAIPDRATLDERGRDWWTPVVTTLLVSLDRARARGSGIVLVGATNHLDRLDAALKRPGRFDRHVEVVGLQGEADIIAVLRHYLGSDLARADLSVLGMLGARRNVTAAVVKEWVRRARERARQRGSDLSLEDLAAEISPPDRRGVEVRRLIATHEAGHAVVSRVLGYSIAGVTIVADGQAEGVVSVIYDDAAATRQEIERRVMVALAGRAADETFGRGATANAAGDLRYATSILSALHGSLGLGDWLTAREESQLSPYDFELQRVVEAELQRLMVETRSLVQAHAPAIEALANRLLDVAVAVQADVDAALALGAGPRPEGLAL